LPVRAGGFSWIDFNDAKNGVKFTLACASYEQGFQDAMLCFTLSGKEEENLRKIWNARYYFIFSMITLIFKL